MYAYIDRAGFRIPTVLAERLGGEGHAPLQSGLGVHVDCAPYFLFDSNAIGSNKMRWRPIQCMLSLTDNPLADTGGFTAVPGFHRRFAEYFEERARENDGKRPGALNSEFMPLCPPLFPGLSEQLQHIPCPRGAAVFWDWRIAHCNAKLNVILLPCIDLMLVHAFF